MSDRVVDILDGLSDIQASLVRHVAASLRTQVEESVNPVSDIVTPEFAEDFRNRLVLFHALNDAPLKKKPFEFAFAGASRAAGRRATVTTSATHAGKDVEVDGVGFSCKTEASKKMSRRSIKISKLMEARWIRDCRSPADFQARVRSRVVAHLNSYERIFTLRAFRPRADLVEYHLFEIPKTVLLLIAALEADQFSARTKDGSSSAVVRINAKRAFTLRLDGSVEKVTVSKLNVDDCRFHAMWHVPVTLVHSEKSG